MLDTRNQLKGAYNKGFLTRQISKAVKEVPEWKRRELADLIEARASIMSCSDRRALEVTLKKLREVQSG